jgi:type IV pilus assembly protein PilF
MLRPWWCLGLIVSLGSCAPTAQERLSDYSQDGFYLFQRGEYSAARECFQAALALRPEDPDLLYNLGACYDRQGQTAKAEQAYGECLQRSANHADCRHALAVLLVHDRRQAEAARMVEGWLAQQPKLADAYAEDGWISRQVGDLPRAKTRFQQALQSDPHNARALIELALVYEAEQRPDYARVLYERILERDPHQPDVVNRLNNLLTQGTRLPHPE